MWPCAAVCWRERPRPCKAVACTAALPSRRRSALFDPTIERGWAPLCWNAVLLHVVLFGGDGALALRLVWASVVTVHAGDNLHRTKYNRPIKMLIFPRPPSLVCDADGAACCWWCDGITSLSDTHALGLAGTTMLATTDSGVTWNKLPGWTNETSEFGGIHSSRWAAEPHLSRHPSLAQRRGRRRGVAPLQCQLPAQSAADKSELAHPIAGSQSHALAALRHELRLPAKVWDQLRLCGLRHGCVCLCAADASCAICLKASRELTRLSGLGPRAALPCNPSPLSRTVYITH